MKKIFTLCVVLCMSYLTMGASTPKHEFRATWLATVSGIDWPKTKATNDATREQQKQELIDILDKMKAGNLNAVCFQVRSLCDAMYQSSYEPWSIALTGTRGKDPGYDPLQFAIDEAHKRGMELHVWVNPFRASTSTLAATDMLWDNAGDWLIKYNNSSFSGYLIDPGYPESRAYVVKVLMEIINNYDVDGLVMDDYFYAYGGTTNQDSVAQALHYRASEVIDVNNNGNKIDDWRRSNVDNVIKAMYDSIQVVKPWVRFGMGPGGIWTTDSKAASAYGISLPSGISGSDIYNVLYCNTVEWIKGGYVDYVNPQIYWSTQVAAQDYDVLCQWWSTSVCEHFSNQLPNQKRVHHFPSLATYKTIQKNDGTYYSGYSDGYVEIQRELDANRKNLSSGYTGAVFYNTTSYLQMSEELAESHFTHTALAPPMEWKVKGDLAAPTNLQLSGTTLSWQHATAERFTVYAYPKGIGVNTATSNPQYLQAVVYDKSFNTSSIGSLDDITIAVYTYDRYGVEHGVALYNADPNATDDPEPEPEPEPEPSNTITWELNGGEVNTVTVEVPTQSGLMLQFMNDYVAYFGTPTIDVDAFHPTGNMTGFLYRGKNTREKSVNEMILDETAGWKWLADYIISTSASNPTIVAALNSGTEVNWRYSIAAFFEQNGSGTYNVDFSIAGQPSKWGTAYQIAHGAVLLPTYVTSAYTLPTPVHPSGYEFLGWYDNAEFAGSPLTTIPANWTGTLYAQWQENDPTIDPTWQILYTSTDGNVVEPYKTNVFGANIVSNTYDNGQGVITFDGPVTSLELAAFAHCSSLTSITIPNSVTSIGDQVFGSCSSLTSITIPNSVTSIGECAFCYCSSLTSITIPNSVTSIGAGAFWECSLLTSITIPNSVKNIGIRPFIYCPSLTSLVVEPGNTIYDSRDNSNAIIERTTNTLIAGCQNTIIPNTVTSIGNYAFEGCSSLPYITIPNSVTSIGTGAFSACSSLISITIPNSVTSVGQGAFYDCSGLTSMTIPNSVTRLRKNTFYNCYSLDTIHVEITTPPTFEDSTTFAGTPSPVCVIPCGTLATYQSSDWANYMGRFVEECTDPASAVTFDADVDKGNAVTDSNNAAAYQISKNGVTLDVSSGMLGTYDKEMHYRIFKNNSITVTSVGRNITKIEFICTANDNEQYGPGWFVVDDGNYAYSGVVGTWIGDAPSVTFTTSAYQVRATQIIVTLVDEEQRITYKQNGGITNDYGWTSKGAIALDLQADYNAAYGTSKAWAKAENGYIYYKIGTDWVREDLIPEGTDCTVTGFMQNVTYNTTDDLKKLINDNEKYTWLKDVIITSRTAAGLDVTDANLSETVYRKELSAFFLCSPAMSSWPASSSYETAGQYEFFKTIWRHAFANPTNPTEEFVLNAPYREGYTFAGWYTTPNFSGGKIETIDVTTAGTLYAKWSTPQFVIFDADVDKGNAGIDSNNATAYQIYKNGVTLDVTSGILGTYNNEYHYRIYKNRSITISSIVGNIAKIEFRCTANNDESYGPGCFTVDGGDYTYSDAVGTWTGDAAIVTFNASANQVRATQIEVTLVDKLLQEKGITYELNGGLPNEYGWQNKNDMFQACMADCGVTTLPSLDEIKATGNDAALTTICTKLTDVSGMLNSDKWEWLEQYIMEVQNAQVGNVVESSFVPAITTTSGAVYWRYALAAFFVDGQRTAWPYSADFSQAGKDEAYIPAWKQVYTYPTSVTSEFTLYDPYRKGYTFLGWYTNADFFGERVTTINAETTGTLYAKWINNDWIITYTSTDGNIVTPHDTTGFGANIVSNIYENGVGTITFDGPVTSIGEEAFRQCSSIASITIPKSVTSIGQFAFGFCSSLTSITIPENVTSIVRGTFQGCSSIVSIVVDNNNTMYDSRNDCNAIIETATNVLVTGCKNTIIPNGITTIDRWAFASNKSLASITIPNTVMTIADHAFHSCSSLPFISIPNSVTSIGVQAFYNCSLFSSFTIPKSVTTIGKMAFKDCTSLDTIYVEATTPPTLGENVLGYSPVFTSSPLCYLPCGTLSAYEASDWASQVGSFVEDCVEGQQIYYTSTNDSIVTPYNVNAFDANIVSNIYENGVGTITFDAPITSIGVHAFQYCSSLTTITIPESVTSIGGSAFANCSYLTSIIIPNGVKSIGGRAFAYCRPLTSITIPNSVTSIGNSALGGCDSLISIVVEEGNTIYDSRNNCNAIIETATNSLIAGCQNTIIPNSVTSIGSYAFHGCDGLTSITIPNSVTSIGKFAFDNCHSLTSVIIPNSVTSIGDYVFYYCSSLTSVTIGNSVTSIGESAFNGCSSLTSITISNSVTSIGGRAFQYCSSLDTIHVEATTPPALEDSTVFRGAPAPVCVIPCGTLAAYEASDWANYMGEFVEEGCAPIQMCGDDLYWEYADGVLTITGTGDMYDYAVENDVPWYGVRGNIKTINMPDEMTKIGDYAFYKCTALTSVTLPEQLKHIGNRAFAQDTKIAGNIVIPEGVNYIEERAFFNLTGVSQFQVLATTPPTLEDKLVFDYVKAPIVIPCGYGLVYRKANIWKDLNLSTCEVLIDNLYYMPVGDNEAHIIGYDNKPAGTLTIPGSVVIGSKTRTVTTLADSLFFDCKEISSVIFNEGLESIGERAFVRCGLTGTIVLPSTLSTIGERAFSYCDNVEKYILQAMTPPALANDVFTGSNSKALFYVSCEAMDDYKVAARWSSLKSRLRDACLNIYHYNTALGANGVYATEETLVAGIYYRRLFTPNVWETLYLPFDVDRVTVLEDGIEYDLEAWSIFSGGHYFLATPYGIENKEVVFGFTTELKPNTPYIIQFKDEYYRDKMITFYGSQSWNHLSTSFEALTSSFDMQMAGNTTLQDQILEEPVYMLRGTSNFILQNATTTLHPFECYVMPYATQSGAPARMNVRFRGDVPTAVESVKGNESHLTYTVDGYTLTVYPQGQAFSIYSLNGALIYSCEAGKEAVDCELNSGCYLLHAGAEAHKIML